MKISDELFQLIKSLSGSEKRYFKLQASLYGREKKYLALFDAIDEQTEYNEDTIRKRFAGEKFIRQLNVAKRYLYDQILKSLRSNHPDPSIRAQIMEAMRNMEILFEKGLIEQAKKMYEKAAGLAVQHERFAILMEIYDCQDWLEPALRHTIEGIDGTHARAEDALARLSNLVRNDVAANMVTLPVIPGHPTSQADLDAFDRGIRLFAACEPMSVRASLTRCWGYASYHFGRGEYAEALRQMAGMMELFEAHPDMLAERPVEYINAINNQLILLRRLGDETRFWETMEKMRSVGNALIDSARLRGPRIRATIFATIALNQLLMLMNQPDLERYAPVLGELEEGYRVHVRHLRDDVKLRIHHNLTLAYFDLGDFRRALHYNNLVLNGPEAPRGLHTYHGARLVHLVIHFELGNMDLLEYLIKSTYRYFRSRNIIHRFEQLILDFFTALPRLRGRDDLLSAFIALRDGLEPLQHDPLEHNSFRTFGYMDWLDKKIGGRR